MARKSNKDTDAKIDGLITELEGITDDKYTSNKDRLRVIQLQTEIENFVEICKKAENDKGIISNNLFDLQINKKYKFLNGPFVSQIFRLIEIQKNKFCFSFGNFKSYIDNKNILIRPI